MRHDIKIMLFALLCLGAGFAVADDKGALSGRTKTTITGAAIIRQNPSLPRAPRSFNKKALQLLGVSARAQNGAINGDDNIDKPILPSSSPPLTPQPTLPSSSPPLTPQPTLLSSSPPLTPQPTLLSSSPPLTPQPTLLSSSPPLTPQPTLPSSSPPLTPQPTLPSSSPPLTPQPTLLSSSPPLTPQPTLPSSSPPLINQPTTGRIYIYEAASHAGGSLMDVRVLSVRDADNRSGTGGFIRYEWFTRGIFSTTTTIPVYLWRTDDRNAAITATLGLNVRAVYRDGLGFISTLSAVFNPDYPTKYYMKIRSTAVSPERVTYRDTDRGKTYYVTVVSLEDGNGVGDVSNYQWQMREKGGTFYDIPGATLTTYTFSIAHIQFDDNGAPQTPVIRVQALHVDLARYREDIYSSQIHHRNAKGRGTVYVDTSQGFATGATIFYRGTMFSDPDGLGDFERKCNDRSYFSHARELRLLFSSALSPGSKRNILRQIRKNTDRGGEVSRSINRCGDSGNFVITPQSVHETKGNVIFSFNHVSFAYTEKDRLGSSIKLDRSNFHNFNKTDYVVSDEILINQPTYMDVSMYVLESSSAGSLITLSVHSVRDANNLPGETGRFIAYFWTVDGVLVSTSQGDSFFWEGVPLAQQAIADGRQLDVVLHYRDALDFGGAVEIQGASVFHNFRAEGAVFIRGEDSFTAPFKDGGDGRSYTVDIDNLTDREGIGTFIYQWQLLSIFVNEATGDATETWLDIPGATLSVYKFNIADAVVEDVTAGNKQGLFYRRAPMLRVRFAHTDRAGVVENLFSVPRAHVNRAPTGTVHVDAPKGFVNGATIYLRREIFDEPDGKRNFDINCQKHPLSYRRRIAEFYYLYSDDNDFATDNLTEEYFDLAGAGRLRTGFSVDNADCDDRSPFVVTPESIGGGGKKYDWMRFGYGENDRLSHFTYTDISRAAAARRLNEPHNFVASRGVRINQPTTGMIDLHIRENNDNGVLVGVVTVVAPSDANNNPDEGGFIRYEWILGETILMTTTEDKPVYFWTNTSQAAAAKGVQLSVYAVYEDGLGFISTLFASLGDDRPTTGEAVIRGADNFTKPSGDGGGGQTYTVDVGGVSDADGLGRFSYQWRVNGYLEERNSGGDVAYVTSAYTGKDIAGAVLSVYTFDVNDIIVLTIAGTEHRLMPALNVDVIHTDRTGRQNTVFVKERLSPNRRATGEVTVDNTQGFYNGATIFYRGTVFSDPDGVYTPEINCPSPTAEAPLLYDSFYVFSHTRNELTPQQEYERAYSENRAVHVKSMCGDRRTRAFVLTPQNIAKDGERYEIIRFGYSQKDALGSSLSPAVGDYVVSRHYLINHPTSGEISLARLTVVATGTSLVVGIKKEVRDDNNNPNNPDDGGFIRYEWLSGEVSLTTTTDDSYFLRAADEKTAYANKDRIIVRAVYRDGLGYISKLTASIASAPGDPVIDGNPFFSEGEQYTVNISGVINADDAQSISYQWARSVDGGASYITIAAATLSVYILSTTDFAGAEAKTHAPLLQVSVSHTDIGGYTQDGFIAEIVYHDAPATGNVEINAATYTADSVITMSINTITDANGVADMIYQWQSGVGDFANIISIGAGDRWTLTAGFAPQDSLRLIAQAVDDFGVTTAFTSAVLPLNGVTEGGLTLSLVGGVIATGATITIINGVSDINGGGFTDYDWFIGATLLNNPNKEKYEVTDEVLLSLSFGGVLRVAGRYEDSLGFFTTLTAIITNAPDFNQPSMGGIGINGNTSLAEGEQYTATLGITDENGLGNFAYQWFRSLDGGVTYTTIADATLSVYTLSTADFVGANAPNNAPILLVSVVHTDAALNAQGGFIASIVYTDALAVGDIKINADTYIVDSVITMSINTIADANGIADMIYQWQSGIGDFTNIISIGAGDRWTLTAGFAPQDSLRLIAQVVDDFGVTTAFTSAVLPLNEETRGAIRLSLVGGIIATGATITIINGVSDINGGGFTDYDWFIGATSLSNPNTDKSKYILAAEVMSPLLFGETLRAEGRYEDSLGFFTTLTAIITNAPDFNQPSMGDIGINGNTSFAEGEQYTATLGITDENGLGSFAYQWFRSLDGGVTYTTITEATLSVYTLSTADFVGADAPNNAPILLISVIHTDGFGNAQGGFIASIVYTDALAVGDIRINADTYTVDSVITIKINTITDANGIADMIYQWQSGVGNFANIISIGADDRWTLTAGFAPQDSLRLIAQVVDDFGVTTAFTSAVLPLNEETRGAIRLSLVGGIIATGATITIINGVSDINGGGFTDYDWFIGATSLSNPNADKSKYILAAEVMSPLLFGETLRAEGRYEDSLGFFTTLTAIITNAPDFNQPSMGGVGINGNISFAEGEQYTATLGITDENGLGSFAYQWFRSLDGGVTYMTITDATLSVYTLSTVDFVGADAPNNAPILLISVIHTDGFGNAQGGFIASIVYTDALAVGDIRINADTYTVDSVITMSINTIADANGIADMIYQWQSGVGDFANIISVGADDRWTLTAAFAPQDSLRLIAQVVDDFGMTAEFTSAVLPLNEETRGAIRLSLVGGVIATGATITIINGVSDINGGGFTDYDWFIGATLLSNPNTDKSKYILVAEVMSPLLFGETLRAEGRYEDSLGFVTTLSGFITNAPDFNQPSMGGIGINGNSSFAEGEQYTADTAGITDENGLGNFAYQWFRSLDGGVTYTPITDATLSVYTLSTADFVGADAPNNAPILLISVIHTDGFGNAQGGFIASIVYTDALAAGDIRINADTYTVDSVITIKINTITDANGIADMIYQWQSGVGDFANVISIGAGDRWTLTAGFAPQDSLRLIAQVIDNFGVTTAFTSAVLPLNEETRGAIRLSLVGGVIATGATITIINGVSDINGGGFTDYDWFIGATLLNNPNKEKYEVTDEVLLSLSFGGVLRVAGRYEDSLGFATTLTATITSRPDFNVPSGGGIGINGNISFAEGEQYTAILGITDENGLGNFAYQWFRSLDGGAAYTTITEATLSVYTLSTADFVGANAVNHAPILLVSVVHTDAALNAQGGFIASIVYTDALATGDIRINADTYTVDSVITIKINTIADENGIADMIYQWQSGVGDFANIISVGAGDRWTLTAGFAPQDSLRLIAQAVDYFGVTVAFTSAVLPLNEETRGAIRLSLVGGIIATGATITIINGVSDINGGGFTDYDWFIGATSLSNPNTDKSKYILAAEVMSPLLFGEILRAEGRYEDSLGFVTTLSGLITNAPDFNQPSMGGIGINGNTSFAEGEQYTATLGIMDENGLGNFAYQWFRSLDGGVTYTPITDATLSVYTLSTVDFVGADAPNNAPILLISVIHIDGFGNAQGGFIASIVYTDALAAGDIRINADTYTVDSVITTNINTITDANGIADMIYQWQSGVGDFANVISIGAGDRWTLTAAFAPQDSLRLIAQVVDDFGVTTAFTSAVLPLNEETRGAIRLSLVGGIIATGATITIINGVSDINGGGFTDYDWFIGAILLSNPNTDKSKYILAAEVMSPLLFGETLRAEGRYEDSLGFFTNLTAIITNASDFNQPSMGGIGINGNTSFAEGEQYTATLGIMDENGLGSFAYQWFRSLDGGVTYTPITDATLSVYTLSTVDFVGADAPNNAPILLISVIHTDGFGNAQGFIASIVYTDALAVGDIRIDVDTYSVDSVITTNINTIADANGIAGMIYQWQSGVGDFANIISIGADDRWTLTAGLAPQDSLRLIARVVDDFGVTTAFTSAILFINMATEGGLTLSLVGGVLATGMTVIIIEDVSDLNGGDFKYYHWFINGTVMNNPADDRYIITPNSKSELSAGAALRVKGKYADGLGFITLLTASIIKATGFDLPSAGTISIDGETSFAEGARYTANINDITDANGIGDFSYQWKRSLDGGATFAEITAAVSQVYILLTANFVNADADNHAPILQVSAKHTDDFGFEQGDFIANMVFSQSSAGGGLSIAVGGYAHGARMKVLNNITDANGGGTLKNIRWQQRAGDNGGIAEIAGENGEVYVIDRDDWGVAERLRAAAVHVDAFGGETNFESPWVKINQPSLVSARLEVLGGGEPLAGMTLSVNIEMMTDDNGLVNPDYQWFSNSSGAINGETDAIYVIRGGDKGDMQVRVVYVDDLGFRMLTTLQMQISVIVNDATTQESLTALAAVLDAAAMRAAINAIDSHFDRTKSSRVAKNDDVYFAINDVEMTSLENLSEALAGGNSLNDDELIAVDKLFLDYSGVDEDGGDWSWWAAAARGNLSGSPVHNNKTLKYKGEHSDIFIGADKQFGDIRAGVVLAKNKGKINMDLRGDGNLDDRITRELNTVTPYVEWSADAKTKVRLLAGYGFGDLDFYERGGCRSDMDVSWLMGGLQGDYAAQLTERWHVELNGYITNSRSDTDDGECGGGHKIPGVKARSGEGKLGVQSGYNMPLLQGGYFEPYIGADSRLLFGDIAQSAVYDLRGGFSFSPPGLAGVVLGMDGKKQLDEATHVNESFGARLDVDYAVWRSSLSVKYGKAASALYRWQINHDSEWGLNTVNSNIYVQQNGGDDESLTIGVLMIMKFL